MNWGQNGIGYGTFSDADADADAGAGAGAGADAETTISISHSGFIQREEDRHFVSASRGVSFDEAEFVDGGEAKVFHARLYPTPEDRAQPKQCVVRRYVKKVTVEEESTSYAGLPEKYQPLKFYSKNGAVNAEVWLDRGQDLFSYSKDFSFNIPFRIVLTLTSKLLGEVAYFHRATRTVHCDIKPENIMVTTAPGDKNWITEVTLIDVRNRKSPGQYLEIADPRYLPYAEAIQFERNLKPVIVAKFYFDRFALAMTLIFLYDTGFFKICILVKEAILGCLTAEGVGNSPLLWCAQALIEDTECIKPLETLLDEFNAKVGINPHGVGVAVAGPGSGLASIDSSVTSPLLNTPQTANNLADEPTCCLCCKCVVM